MTIKQLKKELGIKNADIAEFFGLSPQVYANSTAKQRYEDALIRFYTLVKQKENTIDCIPNYGNKKYKS
jgi:hypothetical protein